MRRGTGMVGSIRSLGDILEQKEKRVQCPQMKSHLGGPKGISVQLIVEYISKYVLIRRKKNSSPWHEK
uniref:SWIB domain-containing protein n=1 Tax=Panagrellus redivivus TaxID=6233 RepID=A0A7E4VK10_PANRE